MATGRIGVTPTLRTRWSKAPAGGTTSLSGLDDNSVSLVYDVGYEGVYRNGVLLSRGNDYTATDGTTVTLIDATITGDIIEIFANELIPLSDAISKGQYTAKGALLSATAASTPGVLTVGSNDQVLTADSSTSTGLKWATPSSGGMTLISTTTLTGSSVSLTSIPQTYNHLQLVIRDFLPANDAAYIRMQYNSDTNSRYNNNTSFGLNQATFNDDAHYASASQDSTLADGISIIHIYDYANTTTWKLANLWSIQRHESTANTFRYANMTLNHNQTIAISSIQLFPDSGNFTSGTVLLYGVK